VERLLNSPRSRDGRAAHPDVPRWAHADEARAHYDAFIAPHFTTDGRPDLAADAAAITAVAGELGVPETVAAAEFYGPATAWCRASEVR
jgi:hypothetical protein